jgi:hypothetical protein
MVRYKTRWEKRREEEKKMQEDVRDVGRGEEWRR